MATEKPARPFYEVFLERVIKIEAVQRYRADVTDDHTAQFFEQGQRPGAFGDFLWSLDRLEDFSVQDVEVVFLWRPNPSATSVSLPMQHAWDAAVAAWRNFIAQLANGELIAEGMNPISGIRRQIDPFEWSRTDLMLNVRNGDLIEGYGWSIGKQTVRWSAIAFPAAIQVQKLGRIDWNDWWIHEVDRRQKSQLPNKKAYLGEAEPLIKDRYGVNVVSLSELRRISAALYRGDSERPKRRKLEESSARDERPGAIGLWERRHKIPQSTTTCVMRIGACWGHAQAAAARPSH